MKLYPVAYPLLSCDLKLCEYAIQAKAMYDESIIRRKSISGCVSKAIIAAIIDLKDIL